MSSTQRRFDASVIQQLIDKPWRFEFFQAVGLIELWLRQAGVDHGQALRKYLRFRNRLSLSFPPSQIAALDIACEAPIDSAENLLDALTAQQLEHIEITPAFMSLLGGGGPLPVHYTESIWAFEQHTRDEAPRAFIDSLLNRSVSMFYEAWTKHRPERMVDKRGGDRLLPMMLALAGVSPGAGVHSGEDAQAEIDDETLASYAAQIRSRSVPASRMTGVLSEYFQVPMELTPFIGCWECLPQKAQLTLGDPNAVLGNGMVLGTRIFRADTRVRLRIGPLPFATFERFLPGTSTVKALTTMLGAFCGTGISFEIRLVLRAADVLPCRLSGGTDSGPRLGYTSFLVSQPVVHDCDDISYLLHP